MSASTAQAVTTDPLAAGSRSTAHFDGRQFELVAQLSAFWARPIAFVDPSYLAIGPLSAQSVAAMDKNPHFRFPINASLAEALGLDRKAPDAAFLTQLAASAPHRLVIALLTAPLAAVHRVGLVLAAAVLSRRISGLIMKSDRMRAREALGEDAFQIAVEEAPLMYRGLSDLDLKAPDVDPLGADAEKSPDLKAFAQALLGRLCDAIAPALADVFVLRFPVDPLFDARARFLGAFTPMHVDLSLRMIRRKEATWLATIA